MNPSQPDPRARLRTAATAAVAVAEAHAFAAMIDAEPPPVSALARRVLGTVPPDARWLTESFVLIADDVCRCQRRPPFSLH